MTFHSPLRKSLSHYEEMRDSKVTRRNRRRRIHLWEKSSPERKDSHRHDSPCPAYPKILAASGMKACTHGIWHESQPCSVLHTTRIRTHTLIFGRPEPESRKSPKAISITCINHMQWRTSGATESVHDSQLVQRSDRERQMLPSQMKALHRTNTMS